MNNIINSLIDYNNAVRQGADYKYKDLIREICFGV